MNPKTTTVTSFSKLKPSAKVDKMTDLVHGNITSLQNVLTWISTLPDTQRMFRISSDILPLYSHECAKPVYDEVEIRNMIETGFSQIGEFARLHDIRLSMHPGQYCVLNSVNRESFVHAVDEFEYHSRLMEMMGYDTGWHPHGASINVHIGGKEGGIENFLKGVNTLSATAQNLITVENDEYSYGLDDLMAVSDKVAIVLDIHHEWIFSGGKYIQPDDARVEVVKDSWRGVRPLGHLSTSRENVLRNHDVSQLPKFDVLRDNGFNLRDLRGHSDDCWNTAVNEWAISHLSWMDIEVEAKNKNLASQTLYKQFKNQ